MSRYMRSTRKKNCMCVLKFMNKKYVRVACNVCTWWYLRIIWNREVHVCVVCGVHTHLHLYVRINTHTWICNCVYTIEHVDMRLCTHNLISTCSYFMCIHAARTFHVYSCNTHISCVFMQHAPFMCICATRTCSRVRARPHTNRQAHQMCVLWETHIICVVLCVSCERHTSVWSKETPPRGGFLFTTFPDQEPWVNDFTTKCDRLYLVVSRVMLQCVAVCCSVLQCVAVCCDRCISSWNHLLTALDQGT